MILICLFIWLFENKAVMKDENGNFISPEEFIPVAEKNGCIYRIGEFVFESVCKFLKKIDAEFYGIEKIDVNLSVMQCMQTSMATTLLSISEIYNTPLNLINFEITETASADYPEVLKQNMHKFADAGIELSLDDYGSLLNLKEDLQNKIAEEIEMAEDELSVLND